MPTRTFVVLEKDDDLRSLYRRKLLQKFPGSTVVEAASCAEAIETLERATVDAVVVNQAALDAKGVEILHLIRGHDAEVPLVAIGDAPLENAALSSGADVFVESSKWNDLGDAVETALFQRPRPFGDGRKKRELRGGSPS